LLKKGEVMLQGMERLKEVIGPAPSEIPLGELEEKVKAIHRVVETSLRIVSVVKKQSRAVHVEKVGKKAKAVANKVKKLDVLTEDEIIAEIMRRKGNN
jgi:hypothetical protein